MISSLSYQLQGEKKEKEAKSGAGGMKIRNGCDRKYFLDLDTEFELSTEVRREERQCSPSISISGPKEVGRKGGDTR